MAQLALLDVSSIPLAPGRANPYDHDWYQLARYVLARDSYVCHWCGERATTGDHLVALCDGGRRLDPDNVVAACKPCNSRRGAEAAARHRSLGRLSRQW